MKFKYKKIAIMISMCTMLIGFIIFTVARPSSQGNSGKEDKAPKQDNVVTALSAEGETKVTASPTAEPTPTPTSVTTLTLDLEPKVTEVVKAYIENCIKGDMDALEEVVSNISMMDEDELKIKYESIEKVDNIECYMIPGPVEGGYLVYAYREFKIKDIETLAPGLSRVYVTIGDDGRCRVFFGADTGIEDFIKKMDESEQVQELVARVNDKLQEAAGKDKKLKKFISGLNLDSDNVQNKDSKKTEDDSNTKKDSGGNDKKSEDSSKENKTDSGGGN